MQAVSDRLSSLSGSFQSRSTKKHPKRIAVLDFMIKMNKQPVSLFGKRAACSLRFRSASSFSFSLFFLGKN